MLLKTASTAFLAGLLAAGNVFAATPALEPIYRLDTSTYGNLSTLQFGSDGRLYSYTMNRTNSLGVAWSIAPNQSPLDLKFIDNPSLPQQPGQSPGPINIGSVSPLVRDAQGHILRGAPPNNLNGQPSTCPYSGADNSVDPPVPFASYGAIVRFGLDLPQVQILSQSKAVPICATSSLALDTSVTPNMLYFVSDIKAGVNIPAENVGIRLYKMPADNSKAPELVYQFPSQTGLAEFTKLIVSLDGQWLYGLKSSNQPAQTFLYRVKPDGTGYQQLQNFTAAIGFPFSQQPGLLEQGDYLYIGVFAGGSGNRGSLLRVPKDFTAASELQTLHVFDGSDGRGARNMTRAGDGNIYGLTSLGGNANVGTVFRIRPADVPLSGQGGVDTNIYSFSGDINIDGSNPAELVDGPDGKLYGVLANGLVYALDIGYVPPAPIFRLFNGTPAQVEWRFGGAASNVALSWNVENAQRCQLEGPGMATAQVPASGSAEVTPAVEGANVYRLSCDNGSGLPTGTASATFQVNAVAPPPPPVINTFSVTPDQIESGATVRFGWSTQDAQTCRGSWSGSPLPVDQLSSGWVDFKTEPTEGVKTFTLTCTGAGGDTVSQEVSITVDPYKAVEGGGNGGSVGIEVSDSGGPVTPWLLLPLSLLALYRRKQAKTT